MKNIIIVVLCAVICLMAAVLTASAFDQNGNDCWCNSDADGCWVTGENGEMVYIMFWSEASREKIMGSDSKAPLGLFTHAGKFHLERPVHHQQKCLTAEEADKLYGDCYELIGTKEHEEECYELSMYVRSHLCPGILEDEE